MGCSYLIRQNYFDFIHLRNISQGINSWENLFYEMYRSVKPGGWVQLGESGPLLQCDDGSMKKNNGLKLIFELLNLDALPTIGRMIPTKDQMQEMFESAGFVDIECVRVKQPIGCWPEEYKMKKIGVGLSALSVSVVLIEIDDEYFKPGDGNRGICVEGSYCTPRKVG